MIDKHSDISRLLAEFERLLPAPEPDRMYMSPAKADEVIAALKKRRDADGVALNHGPLYCGPVSYAGIRIIPLPVGTKIQNKRTGDEAVIDEISIFACTFEWKVAE